MSDFVKKVHHDYRKMLYHTSSIISPSYSSKNNLKNLDPSYKTDLDFWVCMEDKPYLKVDFHKTDIDIWF